MKKLIIGVMCLLPLVVHADSAFKETCRNSYDSDMRIVALLASQSVIDSKDVIAGVELAPINESSKTEGYLITKDKSNLYFLAKYAFAKNAAINVCFSHAASYHPYGYIYGIELTSSPK